MSEIRRNPITGESVIVLILNDNPSLDAIVNEIARLREIEAHAHVEPLPDNCPFCREEGGQEILRLDRTNAPSGCHSIHRHGVPWFTRVLPEQRPLFRIEGTLAPYRIGLCKTLQGIGAHERLIESPYHAWSWVDANAFELASYLLTIVRRINDLRRDARFTYFFPFRPAYRYGSRDHASFHLMATTPATPPPRLRSDIHGAFRYLERAKRCATCDIIRAETDDAQQVIAENAFARAFLPRFASAPFETWVVPRAHITAIESFTPEQCIAFGQALFDALQVLKATFGDFAFTVHVFTGPKPTHGAIADERTEQAYHVRLEFVPRLPYELEYDDGITEATGFAVNYAPPERAVEILRARAKK